MEVKTMVIWGLVVLAVVLSVTAYLAFPAYGEQYRATPFEIRTAEEFETLYGHSPENASYWEAYSIWINTLRKAVGEWYIEDAHRLSEPTEDELVDAWVKMILADTSMDVEYSIGYMAGKKGNPGLPSFMPYVHDRVIAELQAKLESSP